MYQLNAAEENRYRISSFLTHLLKKKPNHSTETPGKCRFIPLTYYLTFLQLNSVTSFWVFAIFFSFNWVIFICLLEYKPLQILGFSKCKCIMKPAYSFLLCNYFLNPSGGLLLSLILSFTRLGLDGWSGQWRREVQCSLLPDGNWGRWGRGSLHLWP